MRALAALQQLRALNLHFMDWAAEATMLGPEWLVARLPRLHILNAPPGLLVRPYCLPAYL